jgi:hypothetical protein
MSTATLRFGFGVQLRSCEDAPQSFVEVIHRVLGIIGANVDNRAFVAGSFFQHVCGNSEPVSAV